MVADAILDCSARGHIVLYGFLGSGTTVIAAERACRRCYGIASWSRSSRRQSVSLSLILGRTNRHRSNAQSDPTSMIGTVGNEAASVFVPALFRNKNRLFRVGDRWFESISLQRGVSCEPDFRGRIPSATARKRGKAADLLTR